MTAPTAASPSISFQANSCSCGATGSEPIALFTIADLNFGTTSQRGRLLRCSLCGSLFPDMFPRSNSFALAYRNYYTRRRREDSWTRSVAKYIRDLFRVAYLDRCLPRHCGSVLDFGCGDGDYLHRVQKRFQATGRFGTDVARPDVTPPLPFTWVPIDELHHSATSYDWITLSHVIEHLPDPLGTFSALSGVISSSGGLWLATPNADSFLFRCFGPNARDVDFPRHRQVFSLALLSAFLQRLGFEVTQRSPPRLNALLNLLSCVENVRKDVSIPSHVRVRIIVRSLWALILHCLKVGRHRTKEAPELVIVAVRTQPGPRSLEPRPPN